jgi:hypothetical protein
MPQAISPGERPLFKKVRDQPVPASVARNMRSAFALNPVSVGLTCHTTLRVGLFIHWGVALRVLRLFGIRQHNQPNAQ